MAVALLHIKKQVSLAHQVPLLGLAQDVIHPVDIDAQQGGLGHLLVTQLAVIGGLRMRQGAVAQQPAVNIGENAHYQPPREKPSRPG